MRSYQAARSLFSFLGFCAWCLIILGVLAAFGGASAAQSFGRGASGIQAVIAAAPGLMMSAMGLFSLALVQMGRTGVDGAEYAQQSLDVARQQLDISKQLLNQGKAPIAPTFADVRKQSTAPQTAAHEEADAAGPSYANQPNTQPRPETTHPDPSLSGGGNDQTPTIAATKQATLPPPSTEITYADGNFIVAGQAFKTKGAAVNHQKELLAIPRGE